MMVGNRKNFFYRRLLIKDSLFNVIAVFIVFFALTNCQQDISENQIIFTDDFEEPGEINAARQFFAGSWVLGSFHNSGFQLPFDNLPDHEYVEVTFDFLAHDSWDGNVAAPSGPDLWTLRAGSGPEISNQDFVFETTFSNTPCTNGLRCKLQSYPNPYPFSSRPRTSSFADTLGRCSQEGLTNGTSYYRVNQIFRHDDDLLVLTFSDDLTQTNTEDPSCDESWSIDNLTVTVWN